MLFLSQVLGEEEDDEPARGIDRRADPGRGSSPARPRPRPAAGATSAPRTAAVSTKARPRSPRCKGCAAAATPAFPCPRKSSTRPSTTSSKCTAARRRRAIQFQGRRRPARHHRRGHRLPVQRRRLRQRIRPQAAGVLPAATSTTSRNQGFGHWHYAHYYYSQVLLPRRGQGLGRLPRQDLRQASSPRPARDGSWNQGYIGPVYTTAINLTILQLDKRRAADLSTMNASCDSAATRWSLHRDSRHDLRSLTHTTLPQGQPHDRPRH